MSRTQFDVVIVGGGMAGLVSALRAAQLGLAVALVEQGEGEQYPCNSRYSGGILHIAFRDIKDPAGQLLDVIDEATSGYADPALARALADTAARAVDWLREQGAKFMRVPGSVWQQWVLAPPRPITGGLDWKGRGPDVTLRVLMETFRKHGGHVFLSSQLSALVERERACAGVEISGPDGAVALESAAVVIADGGFQANLEMLGAHISPQPGKLLQRGAANARGIGLRSAMALGAASTELDTFYGHLLTQEALHNPRLWPYPQLDELATSGIVVDASGHRIADEGLGGVYLANTLAHRADPFDCHVVFDSHIWETSGRTSRIPANPHLLRGGATLLQADTLEALAGTVGVPVERLVQTVEQYNEAVRTGRFESLTPRRSATKHKPMPISQPPFQALPLCAGITYTTGGIAIDEHARVRSEAGGLIGGLYAAGAATGGLEGGPGAGYVGGLMKALVFGVRAAEQVARDRGASV
jgi:fumarate reductase flavoprotein subunit